MLALLFIMQLLSLTQLLATDITHPKKRRHYHKQMTFYDYQDLPLRASQKSTSPRSVPYKCLQSTQHNNKLEFYCYNQTFAKLRALNPKVHLTHTEERRRIRATT
jgi:hypothetical protein